MNMVGLHDVLMYTMGEANVDTKELFEVLEEAPLSSLEGKENILQWRFLLESKPRELPLKEIRRGICEFCEEEDYLVKHHWEDFEGSIQEALVCNSCNSKIHCDCSLVKQLGLFPPWEIQKAYIQQVLLRYPGAEEETERLRALMKLCIAFEQGSKGITLELIQV